MDEIIHQANKLEHGIKMRALALKPFRQALKEYRDKGGENMEWAIENLKKANPSHGKHATSTKGL